MNKQKNQAQFTYAKDLGGLELLKAQYNNQCFSRHVHEGYCIGVIESGAQNFYRSGGTHFAPKNSIILVNADQVHDGYKATDYGWSYQAIYPMPEQFENMSCEFQNEQNDAPWFSDPVVYDSYLAEKLRRLYFLIQNSNDSLQRETIYLSTMLEVISRHSKKRKTLVKLQSEPQAINRVREYLDAHYSENISIQELSNLVGLSPFYLARLFNKIVGLPPHAYQVQRRVNQAKKLIKFNMKLSDVAVECGFTDQSHLTRHFRRALGVAPGAYQRMLRA